MDWSVVTYGLDSSSVSDVRSIVGGSAVRSTWISSSTSMIEPGAIFLILRTVYVRTLS